MAWADFTKTYTVPKEAVEAMLDFPVVVQSVTVCVRQYRRGSKRQFHIVWKFVSIAMGGQG